MDELERKLRAYYNGYDREKIDEYKKVNNFVRYYTLKNPTPEEKASNMTSTKSPFVKTFKIYSSGDINERR